MKVDLKETVRGCELGTSSLQFPNKEAANF